MYERYLNIFISKAHCCTTMYNISVNVGVKKIGYIRNEKNNLSNIYQTRIKEFVRKKGNLQKKTLKRVLREI